MINDTDKTVSMTEANQNFSKVASMAMEYGDVTILKNNKVFLTVHYVPHLTVPVTRYSRECWSVLS